MMFEWFERWFFEWFLGKVLIVCVIIALICLVWWFVCSVDDLDMGYDVLGEEDPMFSKCEIKRVRSSGYGDVVRVGDEYLFIGNSGIVKLDVGEEQ